VASTIKIKRSSVAGKKPTTSDISTGELALNTKDQKLFSSNGTSVFELASAEALANTNAFIATKTNATNPTTSGLLAHTGRATISTNLSVSGNATVTGTMTATGIVSGLELTSTNASGDEGGQINLAKPPNATTSGGVTIDAYQNRLRIFEQGGTARGVYIDLTAAAAGVGTNLLTGGTSTSQYLQVANAVATYATKAYAAANNYVKSILANTNSYIATRASWTALTGTNTAIRALVSDRLQVANASTLYATKSNPTTSGLLAHTGRATISTNLGISGNVNFSSTGNRITGDLSNATVANRVMFQTSTLNSTTSVSAIPNGTSAQADFFAYNSSDPNNSSLILLRATTSETTIRSGVTGTGTLLPMTLWTGNLERFRIHSYGLANVAQSLIVQKNLTVSGNATVTGTLSINGAITLGDASTDLLTVNGRATIGQNLAVAGNTTFSGTAKRVTGDFSNATVTNRLLFQSSTGTFTDIGALGPGAAQTSGWTAYYGNDPTNTSRARMVAFSTDARFESSITGTGTYLPMTFQTGGLERIRIHSYGLANVAQSMIINKNLYVVGNTILGNPAVVTDRTIINGVTIANGQLTVSGNTVLSGRLVANNTAGVSGYYLRTSGTGVYWSPVSGGGANGFSGILVGANVISADSTTDRLTLVAGSGIALAANPTTDTITISTSQTAANVVTKAVKDLTQNDTVVTSVSGVVVGGSSGITTGKAIAMAIVFGG